MRLSAQIWKNNAINGRKRKVSLPMGSRLLYSLFVSPSPARALPCLRTDSRAIFTSRPLISTWASKENISGQQDRRRRRKVKQDSQSEVGKRGAKAAVQNYPHNKYVRTYVRTYVGQRPAYVRDAPLHRSASAPRLLPFSCPAA